MFLIVVAKLFHHHGEAPCSTHRLKVPSPLFQGVSESVPKKEIKKLSNRAAEQPDILALQSLFSLNPVFIFKFCLFYLKQQSQSRIKAYIKISGTQC